MVDWDTPNAFYRHLRSRAKRKGRLVLLAKACQRPRTRQWSRFK